MAAKRCFLWFGLALTLTLTLLHPGFDTSEGSDHLRIALHWLQTGELGLESPPAGIFQPGTDGKYYSAHELGNTVWLAPAAAAGLALEQASGSATLAGIRTIELPAILMPPIFIALTALAFWKLLEWGFGIAPRLRIAASTLLVFGTMLLPYARSLTDVVATGCWLTWGAAFAARAAARGETRSAAIAGVCLGCAFLTRLPSAVVILPVFAWMLATAPRDRRVALGATAIACGLPALAGVMWFNDLRTGSPFMSAMLHPQYAISHPGRGSFVVGLTGLLISPGKGLLLFSPVMVVAAMGVPRMWREARAAAVMVLSSLALFLAAHGSLYSWHGDWGWGPRYFVFVLPLLWLPAAFAVDLLRRSMRVRRIAMALAIISIAIQASAIVTNWHYQYQVRGMEGRLRAGMHWSADNQLTDAVTGAVRNVSRLAGLDVPVTIPPGVSHHTVLASTGINVWWVTALRAGFAPWQVIPPAALIAAIAAIAWRRVMRSVRREDTSGGLDLGLAR